MNGGPRSKPGTAAPDADGLSVVVPIYNEASNLPALHERLTALAQRLNKERQIAVEVVYVDDGSRDNTVEIARRLPAENFDLQLISFSRNFGKEAALLAVARRGLRRGLHREDDARGRVGLAPARGAPVLSPAQLGRAVPDPGGRQRLSAVVAARGRGVETASRTQSLLQGVVELDRLPAGARAL